MARTHGAKGQVMNVLNSMLLSFYAQAATSAAPSAAPASAPPDAAQLEAARQAAEAAAKEAAGQGQTLNLLTLFNKLEGVEKTVLVILLICAIYSIALLFEKVFV